MKAPIRSSLVAFVWLLAGSPLVAQEDVPSADSVETDETDQTTPSADAPFIFASLSPAASIRTRPDAGQADPLGIALLGAAGISHPRWSLGLQLGGIHTTVPAFDFVDALNAENAAGFFREAVSLAVGGMGRVTVIEFAETPVSGVADYPFGEFVDCVGFCPKATGIFLSGSITNYWTRGEEGSDDGGFAASEGWLSIGLDAALHRHAEVRGLVGVGYNDRLDRVFESLPFRGRVAALLSVRLNSTVAVVGSISTNFPWSDAEREVQGELVAGPESESSFTVGVSLLQSWLLDGEAPS